MSKVVSKGHLIDEYCKYTSGDLVDVGGDVYTCMLNQTDIKSNKNKYPFRLYFRFNKEAREVKEIFLALYIFILIYLCGLLGYYIYGY